MDTTVQKAECQYIVIFARKLFFNFNSAGFYCHSKSHVPNPGSPEAISGNYNEGAGVGWVCKSGHYCPEGTQSEVPCPAGTFYDGKGAQEESDCQYVPPGKYSTMTGATSTLLDSDPSKYGNCKAGYVCLGGSSTETPEAADAGTFCQKGQSCPEGTNVALECPIGKYAPDIKMGECRDCPAGTYCDEMGMDTTDDCTHFHYCELGSSSPTPCPPGTYSPINSVENVDGCAPCPGGIACELPGTALESLKCAEGYVCGEGSKYEMPAGTVYDETDPDKLNGFCPVGAYCSEGTSVPTPCPEGKFQDSTGNSECKDCFAGYGCTSLAMWELKDSDKCEEGFICGKGSTSTAPSGSRCSADHFCERGTSYEMRCPDGTYQSTAGKGSCDPCIAGKSCFVEIAGSSPVQKIVDCPEYYYCPGGSGRAGKFCEPGTTSTAGTEGLKYANECILCPSTFYCVDSGKGASHDKCAAGYFCVSGAKTPTPNYCPPITTSTTCTPFPDDETAYLCPPGHFCGTGTPDPTICPSGKFRLDPGAMIPGHCTNCLPGEYCVKDNPVPYPCPTGSYCPLGSTIDQKCQVGTYNPNKGSKYEYECELCPAGYFCKSPGISDLTLHPCPPSSYCLEASVVPVTCKAGLYISGLGKSESDCKPCTETFYCMSGTSKEVECPDGSECPPLSPAPARCEAGYCCYWDMVTLADGTITFDTFNKEDCPINFYCETG